MQVDHSYTTGFLVPSLLCVMCFFQSDKEHEEKIAEQRLRQHQLIPTGSLIPNHLCVMCFFQSDKEHEEKIAEQREKQRKLITQLKSQLEDLETYAYEVSCLRQHCTKAAHISKVSK